MAGLLTRKALVLFKIETTAGTDAAPTHLADAMLVEEPEFSIDPEVITRDFLRDTLTPNPSLVGRKLAQISFMSEIRGNGQQQSGLVADAPMVARAMQACGMELNPMNNAASQIGTAQPDYDNPSSAPAVSFASGGAVTLATPVLYTITVVTPGASGIAQVSVTSNNAGEDNAPGTPETLTDGLALSLGAKGGEVTPTWTGDLVAGQKWRVLACPTGVEAKPVSKDFDTATIYLYRDGLLHKVTAAMGTFEIEAEAGQLAKITFTFTGNYVPVEDQPLPTGAVFESTLPAQVEFANLTYQSNSDLLVSEFSLDMGNEINPRPSVNHGDGYFGVRLTAREPQGGFNPEAELEASAPFWADMASSKVRHFYTKIGSEAGNTVAFEAPGVQTNSLGYGDRDGILSYEVGMNLTGQADDELRVLFV